MGATLALPRIKANSVGYFGPIGNKFTSEETYHTEDVLRVVTHYV